jgi:hypothetical protein
MKVDNIAIGFTIFLVVMAILFLPVGYKQYSQIDNVRNQTTTTVTYGYVTQIAPKTTINITSSVQDSYIVFDMWYNSQIVSISNNQSLGVLTTYTTDGGTLKISADSIGVTSSEIRVQHADYYGLDNAGKTILDNLGLIIFSVIIIAIVLTLRRDI